MNSISKFVSSSLVFLCFTIAQQNALNEGTLPNYNFSEEHSRTITLPKQLNEISGLAITGDNRLFAHNDEIGTVYEVDIKTGKILYQFYLGKKKLKKDFEGIAAVNDSLFLVTSSGVLYKFNYPDDERNVEYIKVKTFLSAKFNVEGLCYDKATNSLLLACKDYAGENLTEYKAIYAFDLSTYILNEEPRFLINLDSLKNKFNINNFSPTGIEVHPNSANIYILSSHEKMIVELSSDGELLNAVKLKSKNHRQPEGIAFLSDLSLLISDEGKEGKAKVTFITLNSNLH
ncbi:MAG: SdiA-regulated domain-containing protein [Bacteroidetes bacterium]|nr:SdiA-regulated domain-containing protein [Bacteroidota bacterium]